MSREIALFLDPPSEHFLEDRLFDPSTAEYGGSDILAPFRAVRTHFEGRGIPVHTADLLEDEGGERHKIYVSFGLQGRSAKLARRDDVTASAYFAMECPIVEPSLYRGLPEMERRFRRLYTWAPAERLQPFTREPLDSRRFFWPQARDRVIPELWERRDRDFLVMINSNKLPRLYDRELYTERVQAVEHFHRFGEVDLYGPNWDRSPRRVGKTWMPGLMRMAIQRLSDLRYRLWPPSEYEAAAEAHQGFADSKSEALSRYDFALCFENMVLEGWITEKLFDCLYAGTVPIYWGAPDIREWVDPDCFVDMRDFEGYGELREHLRSLGSDELERYRQAGREYLASDAFDRFRTGTFVERLEKIVAEDAGLDT